MSSRLTEAVETLDLVSCLIEAGALQEAQAAGEAIGALAGEWSRVADEAVTATRQVTSEDAIQGQTCTS